MRTRRKNKTSNTTKKIVERLQNITLPQIEKEFEKLRDLKCTPVLPNTRLGNAVVNYFTMEERLHTKGHRGINFYTFWKHRKTNRLIPHVRKMLDFYKTRDIDEIRKFKYIFNLYYSSIAVFKPVVAMKFYCSVKAKHVLDFTMGWGGRLVGACALDLESYIGIDMNIHLRKPYERMTEFLKGRCKTNIQLFFQDALEVDYSKLHYDTVFTSPPYYSLEQYRSNNTFQTKQKWHDEFYVPLFTRVWKHLQTGSFCLNVPEEIYETSCVPILGPCHKKQVLDKRDRSANSTYQEFVYMWFKT